MRRDHLLEQEILVGGGGFPAFRASVKKRRLIVVNGALRSTVSGVPLD